jgi:Protein of unknown function (DUF3108)
MKKMLIVLMCIPVATMVSFTRFGVAEKPALPETPTVYEDGFCGIANTAFRANEQIQYIVFYNVVGVYVHAGDAVFNCSLEKLNGRPVYHIEGVGNSNSRYDWIFKVRDKYESWMDTAAMRTLKFVRNVSEGTYRKHENVTFNRTANTATSTNKTYKVPECIQDVLSATYYARNINFDKLKTGDKVYFSMTIDDEVYNMYIKYIGREKVKTRYGQFRSIKFKPLLIKGTIFTGGEKMTVWVSDDANRLPLRIESPISVGSVKVDMMGYRNLRHPLSSLISFRK